MTTKEFSDSFNVLMNSNATIQEFGSTAAPNHLDEYEKSVFLTEAQEQIVQGLYEGSLAGLSFEETESLRRSLDALIETDHPNKIPSKVGLSKDSVFYQLADDVWYITYESVDLVEGAYCKDSNTVRVIPVRQDEWHRIKGNPFQRPNKRKVARLDAAGNIVELISAYPIDNYLVRYLRKPKPIILVELDDGLSIGGLQEVTECELNTSLHKLILERAVQLAKGGGANDRTPR